MYSTLPIQPSVVCVPVTATSTASLHMTTPGSSNLFDGRYSAFRDECVDFTTAQPPSRTSQSTAASPARSISALSDRFALSPRSFATPQRSTPLKPAKRDRAVDDDDRQILRCKRSLALSSNGAQLNDGGSQEASSSTSTFAASESVERRNLRERRRIKLINVTFATLRNRLPSYCWQRQQRCRRQQQRDRDRRQPGHDNSVADHGTTRRASKVDTLRTAISYIRSLEQLLADDDRQRMSTSQTFDAAAETGASVCNHRWTTAPYTAAGHDTCSSMTSEDLSTAAVMSTRVDSNPVYSDQMVDRDVAMSPIPDIFDWFI